MIKINQRIISLSNEPYIIAELSANHNGSLERAKLSIKSAKESGAHAVAPKDGYFGKNIGTYSSESEALNVAMKKKNSGALMVRVGEVAALRYCDVVDSNGQILAETVLAAAQTKGDKSRRIWFNERMRAELAAYVAAHKPKHKTQKLFYTQRSEGFTANTLTHIINSFYQKAGIANASSHSGRRSGLTTLADKGVSVRVLMALAGHSQIATTQRYIDLRPSVVRAAVELV